MIAPPNIAAFASPRQLRKATPMAEKQEKVRVNIDNVKLIGWRNMKHPSSQVYLMWISDDGKDACTWLITQKCELKRSGFSTPSPEQLQAWAELTK